MLSEFNTINELGSIINKYVLYYIKKWFDAYKLMNNWKSSNLA